MGKGFVYILTNPSMQGWIKIGSTQRDDVQKRVKELSDKTAVPLSFRVYATLETDKNPKIIEHTIHEELDEYKPDARATEINLKGKQKKREFFQTEPETAYKALVRLAKVTENSVMPKKWEMTPMEQEEDDIGGHRKKISFAELGISTGSKLFFSKDKTKICIVQKNNRVLYKGKITSLSALARELIKSKYPLQGTAFWEYNGESLWNRRLRMEKEKKK